MFAKASVAVSALLAASAVLTSAQSVPKFQYGTPNPNAPGVVGKNKNGPTNPAQPSLNTPINQKSMARLVSVNSIDDWCTFAPPNAGDIIGNVEGEVVAYCTKPRNNARVIPDGTVTAAHFVKTPLYVQLMALGDFTKIGFAQGDYGGELDPHGATNQGNPVGGNVTSNVSGKDVFYEEWMNFVAFNEICIRICIAGTDVAPTPLECQHTLDEMGCNFVMPGNYADNVFETCDGDSAYPPGLYPQADGSTSTFQQYFSSVFTDTAAGATYTFVNGSPDQITPSAAYSLPSTSNCVTTSTIANGIASLVPSSSAAPAASSASSAAGGAGMSSSRSAGGAAATGSGASSSGSSSSSQTGAAASVSSASALFVAGAGALVAAVALL